MSIVANGITDQQVYYCFEILEVPYSIEYYQTTNLGMIVETQTAVQVGQRAITVLTNAIGALSGQAVTEVQTLCSQWAICRLQVAGVMQGNVGDIGQVRYTPEDQRAQIRHILYKYHEILLMQLQDRTPGGNGVTVPRVW
jgi:hypothetical protein